MLSLELYVLPLAAVVLVVLLAASVRILREYERAVVFTLGRFQRVKGPGLVLLLPFIQEMVRVDLRIKVIEIPSQDVISRDNVSMKVDAVLYFCVVNPERAIIRVQDYLPATNMLAQTTLRAVLGQHELDEMLSERKKLSADVQSILDAQTETWGIKVSNVEIRTVELTENMVRAIAKQAEAERDRRAKVIHAEAEFQASQTLVDAAKILGSVPAAMQLRYLQTLAEIGAEQNSTVVFPMPIDIMKPFLEISSTRLARRRASTARPGRNSRRRGPERGRGAATGSGDLSHRPVRSDRQPMPREPFGQRLGRLGEALQRIREILEPGRAFRRAEAGRALDRLVPGGRPDAVGFAPARRPGQHRGVEGDPAGRAERGQRAARVGEHACALDHRRGAAEPVGGAVEQRELGGQADLVEA